MLTSLGILGRNLLYSVYCGSEGASSSFNDVDGYVVIRKLLDSNWNIHPVFVRRWEIQTYIYRAFLQ
jgi:hypothetical protein